MLINRMMVFGTVVGIGLGASAARGGDGSHEDHAHAKIGHPAPQFTLQDTRGKTHSLADILKKDGIKAVVLEWFNHDCPFCARHGKNKTIIKLVDTYGPKGVVFLGVDTTSWHDGKLDGVNKAIQEWGVNYPILTDFDGKVGHQYGAKTTPHMFVISREGIVVYDGALDDDPRGSKPAGERTDYVAKALNQLLVGETVEVARTKPYGCSVKYKR